MKTMSSKKRETAIKTKANDGSILSHAAIVALVFRIHQGSHHYSLRTKQPTLYDKILSEISDIPLEIVKSSYDIYKAKRIESEDKKAPHPNYFLKVCKAQLDKLPGKYINTVWGKEI